MDFELRPTRMDGLVSERRNRRTAGWMPGVMAVRVMSTAGGISIVQSNVVNRLAGQRTQYLSEPARESYDADRMRTTVI
jgi:hypothetical protein